MRSPGEEGCPGFDDSSDRIRVRDLVSRVDIPQNSLLTAELPSQPLLMVPTAVPKVYFGSSLWPEVLLALYVLGCTASRLRIHNELLSRAWAESILHLRQALVRLPTRSRSSIVALVRPTFNFVHCRILTKPHFSVHHGHELRSQCTYVLERQL